MLGAQIVTAASRSLWASEEPDLLWALRGGGGNFGVVSALKLRAHKYNTTNGLLPLYSPSSRISWGRREAHARSEEGFKWALDFPSATKHLHDMRSTKKSHGTAQSWLQAALISDVDDETFVRAWKWYEDVVKDAPELGYGTFALLEVMQKPAFCSSPSPSATAWPHGAKGQQHVLQLSVGGPPAAPGSDDLANLQAKALGVLAQAPAQITSRSHPPGDFLPNFLLKDHDLAAVFEGNWERLEEVKRKYDGKGRFNKGFFVPPAEY